MKRLFFLGLLVMSLFIVMGCLSPTEELSGEENTAIAGLAISMGCQTYSRGVTSCTTNADGSISVTTRANSRVSPVADLCRSGVAYDYSCIPGKSGSRSIAYRLCRTQCESAEDCVNARCVSRCANGVVDAGENCVTCAADVLCADGEVCQEGICVVPCTPSTEACDGMDNSCDGSVDESGVCNTNENCGMFGNACAVGQSCSEGVCVMACLPSATCPRLYLINEGNFSFLHYDGVNWALFNISTNGTYAPRNLVSVYGMSENDIYVLSQSTLNHYDGTEWSNSSLVSVRLNQYLQNNLIARGGFRDIWG